MDAILFSNARIFDGHNEGLITGKSLLVADGRIQAMLPGSEKPSHAREVDLDGRVLMPGLIDAHYHAYISDLDFAALDKKPMSYLAHPARKLLEASLHRGFTTIRDVAGAEYGLWKALDDGLFDGPRLFYGGKALSQTGGHGDMRSPSVEPCGCGGNTHFSRVVDGVDAIRIATREELRRGAHHIKVMVSGGIASPSDPVWSVQYALEELEAVVDEARRRQVYVVAHAYTAEAVTRAVKAGIRSIEHGNLIDQQTAELMAREGAFLVPTLVTYETLKNFGRGNGVPDTTLTKLEEVREKGLQAIAMARAAGVKIGFGTDLLGDLHQYQLEELTLRSRVETPFQILHSATGVNAELLMQAGQIGCIAEGAHADLLVVNGNPLEDLSLLSDAGGIALVMKGGKAIRSSLHAPL